MKPHSLTAPYAAVQAVFWMSFCVTIAFAAVYLQALGYSNTELGAILAAGNLFGTVLGPSLCAHIDADARRSAAHYIPVILAAQSAALLVLLLVPVKGVVTTLAFIAAGAFCIALNSLLLKLYVDAEHAGVPIQFSTARGFGSIAYVLLSALLGVLITRLSVHILPLFGLLLCAVQLLLCRHVARALPASGTASAAQSEKQGTSLAGFARKYPHFCLVLLGTVPVFFAHNTLNNFLINITRNVGGSTLSMGYLNAFIASVEIPVMLLFFRIRGKLSSAAFLGIAYGAFLLKTLAVAAAPTVPALFAAFLLQAPSFGLYAPVSVDYAADTVPYEDSAKAQSLSYSTTTVGSVLSGVISGRLFDAVSVTQTLLIASGICAVGLAVSLFGLFDKSIEHQKARA